MVKNDPKLKIEKSFRHPSKGAGTRIRIVFINEDCLRKRGPMRPQK